MDSVVLQVLHFQPFRWVSAASRAHFCGAQVRTPQSLVLCGELAVPAPSDGDSPLPGELLRHLGQKPVGPSLVCLRLDSLLLCGCPSASAGLDSKSPSFEKALSAALSPSGFHVQFWIQFVRFREDDCWGEG